MSVTECTRAISLPSTEAIVNINFRPNSINTSMIGLTL